MLPDPTGEVVEVLDDDGWTEYVVQSDRDAWNSEAEPFQEQHAAATGTFGFLGRNHARLWEFGGFTSCSAHVDSAVPHEATSFEGAEGRIDAVFEDAAGWTGHRDYYELDNGVFLDHDGEVTRVSE